MCSRPYRPFGLPIYVARARRLHSRSYPSSLYLLFRKSLSSIETQSLPSLLRCYPRSFTFYLGNPFPRLKLSRYPRSFAATLAALPSISEIPFLDSCVADSLFRFRIRSFGVGRWALGVER